MEQGDLFRDEGIKQVEGNANSNWMSLARDAVFCTAEYKQWLTTDHIWDKINDWGFGEATHDNRAMGAVMRKAQAEGWIEPTDRVIKSTRAVCHSRPIRVWKSKLI